MRMWCGAQHPTSNTTTKIYKAIFFYTKNLMGTRSILAKRKKSKYIYNFAEQWELVPMRTNETVQTIANRELKRNVNINPSIHRFMQRTSFRVDFIRYNLLDAADEHNVGPHQKFTIHIEHKRPAIDSNGSTWRERCQRCDTRCN